MKFEHLRSSGDVWAWAKRLIDDLNKKSVSPPVGSMIMWSTTATLPQGWVLANGAVLNKSDYPALFIALGNTVGATFTVPNVTSPAGSRVIIKA